MVLFAVSPSHTIPIGWTANRAALASLALALAAITAHVKWRRDGWRPGSWILFVTAAGSLLVSEYGLGLLAYLLAYELLSGRGFRRALVGCGAVAAAACAYLGIWSAWGAGVSASTMYVDPLAEPARFLSVLGARWLALMWQVGTQLPCEASIEVFERLGTVLMLVLLAATVAALVALALRLRLDLRWLVLGTALSLLPLVGTIPSARLLGLPAAGAALLLSALAGWACQQGGWRFSFVGAVALIHGVGAALGTLVSSAAWHAASAGASRVVFASPALGSPTNERCFVIVNAPDVVAVHFAPLMLAARDGALPRCWLVLAASNGGVELTAVDAHSVRLRAMGAGLLDSTVVGLSNPRRDPAVLARPRNVTFRVLASGPHGPLEVELTTAHRLDVESTRWLTWTPDGFEPLEAPQPGHHLRIGH